jgi:hypothetical protein
MAFDRVPDGAPVANGPQETQRIDEVGLAGTIRTVEYYEGCQLEGDILEGLEIPQAQLTENGALPGGCTSGRRAAS